VVLVLPGRAALLCRRLGRERLFIVKADIVIVPVAAHKAGADRSRRAVARPRGPGPGKPFSRRFREDRFRSVGMGGRSRGLVKGRPIRGRLIPLPVVPAAPPWPQPLPVPPVVPGSVLFGGRGGPVGGGGQRSPMPPDGVQHPQRFVAYVFRPH